MCFLTKHLVFLATTFDIISLKTSGYISSDYWEAFHSPDILCHRRTQRLFFKYKRNTSPQRLHLQNAHQPTIQPNQIHQCVGGPIKERYVMAQTWLHGLLLTLFFS